jgi:hypothetical protein
MHKIMVKKFNSLGLALIFMFSLVLITFVSAHACENGGILWNIDENGDSIPCYQSSTWPFEKQYHRLVWWKNAGCGPIYDYAVHPERYVVRACDGDDSCCACAQYHANFDPWKSNPNDRNAVCEPVGTDDDGDGVWGNWHPDYIRASGPFAVWYNPGSGSDDDCDDSDASVYPGAIEICDDGKDNDCDGSTDCSDSECSAQLICNPQCLTDSDCSSDFFGNNYCSGDDVWRVFHDFSCIGGQCIEDTTAGLFESCSFSCTGGVCDSPACSDGQDNDGDSLIDSQDPGCFDSGFYDPSDNDETDTLPECSNFFDDDGDSKVDMADPGCSSTSDDNETDEVSIACYNNSDCGSSSMTSYCNGLSFITELTTPTCSNPGTAQSSCSDVVLPMAIGCFNICSDFLGCDYTQCSDRQDNDGDGDIDSADSGCWTNPLYPNTYNPYDDDEACSSSCVNDTECGTESYSLNYCNGDDVVRDHIIPACLTGFCSVNTTVELVEHCDDYCSNGVCKEKKKDKKKDLDEDLCGDLICDSSIGEDKFNCPIDCDESQQEALTGQLLLDGFDNNSTLFINGEIDDSENGFSISSWIMFILLFILVVAVVIFILRNI